MKREKNLFEGSRQTIEDEAHYEDRDTILLINFIVDLVVTATLSQAETLWDQPVSNEGSNHSTHPHE